MVAAAVGIGSAVAGVAGAAINSGAASSAAGAQSAAAQQSAQLQRDVYNTNNTLEQPFRLAGQDAVDNLDTQLNNGSLTFNPIGGSIFNPTQAQLASTPGYQFLLNQGQQAVANSNAATGRGLSGAALKGGAQYAEGLAGTTLSQQQQIFQNNLQNQQAIWQGNLSPRFQLASQGLNAINPGANVLSGQGIGSALAGAGNAQASGIIGAGNALSGGINSAASGLSNYALYNSLLNGGTDSIGQPSNPNNPYYNQNTGAGY